MRLGALFLIGALAAWGAESHPAKGIVLKTDDVHHLLTVSCEAIPGYMDAMEMEFIAPGKRLGALKPGTRIQFVLLVRDKKVYAEDIREGTTATFESEPMAAGQLTALNGMLEKGDPPLAVGQRVPDFALTDQAGATVHFSDFAGKVVAITFGYSRCPNPNYCFRLSNNLARVEARFRARAGRDLVLLTIMMDPEHDQGPALTEYANVWKANPSYWHFLTGPLPEIKRVAAMFGVNFWSYEGLLTHSLHTIIVDRRGEVAANLEGNQFSAQELGDLVRTMMERK